MREKASHKEILLSASLLSYPSHAGFQSQFHNTWHIFHVSGVNTTVQESKAQNYRPAFLDHFEKLEENKRNLDGKRSKGNGIRSDPSTQFPSDFLGPMDFDFVSDLLLIELMNWFNHWIDELI